MAPPSPAVVKVQAGRTYRTSATWHGQPVPVSVTFDAYAATRLLEQGQRLELQACALVDAKGQRQNLLGPSQTGPWRMTLAGQVGTTEPSLAHAPVLATDVHVISDVPSSTGERTTVPWARSFLTDLEVFSNPGDRQMIAETEKQCDPASAIPLALSASQMERRDLVPGLTVTGVDATSLRPVEDSISAVLGKSLPSLAASHSTRQAEAEALSAACDALYRAQGGGDASSLAAAVAEAKLLLGPDGGEDPQALFLALRRAADSSTKSAAAVEVVVVPEGKRICAMPQYSGGGTTFGTLGTNVTTPPEVRTIFVPQGDVMTQRHELYHYVYQVLLSQEDRDKVNALYARAVQQGGPFARAYGTKADEFFTTWAELFEGAGGDAGRHYLARKAPEILEILERFTGRTMTMRSGF